MPTYLPDEAPVWSGEMSYDDRYPGTLYVTNRRLLFEHRVGTVRKRNVLAADIPLGDITSTTIEKGPWDWTALILVANGRRHRFLFRLGSPEELVRRIGDAMAAQRK